MDITARESAADSAIAHIEAQDVTLALPLREYLQHHGCRVVVNQHVHEPVLYQIGVGEVSYVKRFFARTRIDAAKKIAVVYGDDSDDLSALTETGIKVYYADAVPFAEATATDIFSFFFTGNSKTKDTRKAPRRAATDRAVPKEAPREPFREPAHDDQADRQRVAHAMSQIFRNDTVAKSHRMTLLRYLKIVPIILVACVSPFVMYLVSMLVGAGLLAASGRSLLHGNITWASTLQRSGHSYISNARSILGIIAVIVPGQLKGYAKDQERLLAMLTDASKAEENIFTIFTDSKSVAGSILIPGEREPRAAVSEVASLNLEMNRVSQHLALIQAELESLLTTPRFPFTSAGIHSLGSKGMTALSEVRAMIQYSERLLTIYPHIAGFRDKQEYLVLLQNSMELRPTGGFIGSLLHVTFFDGVIEEMRVLDVYTADGQLKGHVDPPLPVREIIGQEHWYLRDSNWDPDFEKSGEQAAWFYEKELGHSVDGVIAVSLPVLTRLLHILGPVDLPDFNERITESNFFIKSLLYTQVNFFPGSTQKKDFLGALTNAVMLRMTSDAAVSSNQLLRVVSDSLNARDIQFYFSNPSLQQLVSQWGWAGDMQISDCRSVYQEPVCIGDGIAVIEANVGINKANYFVQHEALSDITISEDGMISHVLTVNIKNSTPKEVPEGGGPYQNYLRVYMPAGTVVNSVRLDGFDVEPRDMSDPAPPPAPYLVVEPTGYLTVIGLPFVVDPGYVRSLVIETERKTEKITGSGVYQFTMRKQAGVSSYPWYVVVRYPPAWGAVADAEVAKPGALEYNTTLETDTELRILFQNSL